MFISVQSGRGLRQPALGKSINHSSLHGQAITPTGRTRRRRVQDRSQRPTCGVERMDDSPNPATEVIVASQNPVKLGAARDGFSRMFPDLTFAVRGISVPSGVPDQPFTDEETLEGALTRARNARDAAPDASYWIGLEGGVDSRGGDGPVQSFAWIAVLGEGGERVGKARTATYYLPEETARLLREGMELGHADDLVHGRTNSKQKSGSVGILTHDVVNRQSYYSEAVVLALIPFKNSGLTF